MFVQGMASYLWDHSFFTKFAFNLLLRSLQSRSIVHTTINDYLWNFTDPILDVAQTVAPSLVPAKNMGILHRVSIYCVFLQFYFLISFHSFQIYSNFEDLVTVYIGQQHGHEKFFKIDKYEGSEYLPGYGDTCNDKIVNSTEGVAYHQFLTKNSTLLYWRKTICKVTPLYYKSELFRKLDFYTPCFHLIGHFVFGKLVTKDFLPIKGDRDSQSWTGRDIEGANVSSVADIRDHQYVYLLYTIGSIGKHRRLSVTRRYCITWADVSKSDGNGFVLLSGFWRHGSQVNGKIKNEKIRISVTGKD